MPALQAHQISCPYCGEFITVLVDTSGGNQQYYEDCQVCCTPIFFDLLVHHDNGFTLNVMREDQ